jgi:predicted restriction endonuclease
MTPKLKTTGVAPLRRSLLETQGYKCAICGLDCSEEQAVLDHDHVQGHVRGVLHRGCNAAEGKILKSLKRYGIKDPRAYLEGMVKYHQTHAENQTGFIHPSHFTPEEKIERAKAKRIRLKLKTTAAKS